MICCERSNRIKFLMLPALPVVLLLTSIYFAGCGTYHTAEIAGYVKDSESKSGINGALVRVYLSEEDTEKENGFIVETATMSYQGNDGYYSHKIIWQKLFPRFGQEGDSGVVWLQVSHEDYSSRVVKVAGIITETLNLVPDILLNRATFSTPQVNGRVVNIGGEGVNGVRVALDLASTGDDDEDYVTTTTEIDGEQGRFRFQDVTWRDENPDSAGADTETAYIVIDDPNYEADERKEVTLTSNQTVNIPEDIVVSRKPRSNFSTTVQGRCIYRIIDTDKNVQTIPVSGVEVTLSYKDDNGDHSKTTQADTNGEFSFLVQWKDESPEESAPAGEDILNVTVSFTAITDPGNKFSADAWNGDIKSWIDPFNIPDAVDTDPNT